MKSRASLHGHPVHAMLVSFPIAFIVGAAAFDLVGVFKGWPTAWTTGAYLSLTAVASGLLAAVPGIVDYVYSIPPDSSAKSRGTRHMLVNVSALASIGVGWFFRERESLEPGIFTLALEALSVVLVGIGGWLGGTLVFRNQIGVDHRYANAAKWSEAVVAPGEPAAREDELKPGQMKLVTVGDERVALAKTDHGHVAFDDRCPHKGGPLSDGALICGAVQCPWHGSQFDVVTGAVVAGPAERPIRTHAVEVSDGEVRVRPSNAPAAEPT